MASVGTSVPRTDGEDKVTGRAEYVDDLSFLNAHGATIRSTDAHALDGVIFDLL